MAKSTTDAIKKFKTPKGLNIHILFGDITKAKAVAIVVPEENFQTLGMVGEALVKIQPKFKERRDKLIRKHHLDNTHWKVFVSKLGEPFKYVLHAVLDHCKSLDDWTRSIDLLYNNVLVKAEEEKIKSLALPLLGSGQGGENVEDAINVLLDAITSFKPKKLKLIIIVSHQRELFDRIVGHCEIRLFSEQPGRGPESRSNSVTQPIGKSKAVSNIDVKNDLSIGSTAIFKPVKSLCCFHSSSVELKSGNCHGSRSTNTSEVSNPSKTSLVTSIDDGIKMTLRAQTHPNAQTKTLPPEQRLGSRIFKHHQCQGGAKDHPAEDTDEANKANDVRSQRGQPAPVRGNKLAPIERGQVLGDTGRGNCMFVSLSKQLKRVLHQDIGHSELRVKLVQYLRDNPYQPDNQPYSDFLTEDESWERFLERMSRDGQWGDHLILQAAAELYTVEIIVIDDKNDQISVKPSRPCSYQLLLRFSRGRHYESIE